MALQVVVSFNGRPVGKWALDRPRLAIGRAPENEIQLDAQVVSRQHAVLERAGDDAFLVRDLGTINGTWVNGARIEAPVRLRVGDVIQLGAFALLVGDEHGSGVVPVVKRDKKSGDGWIATSSRDTAEDHAEREASAGVRAYLVLGGGPPRVVEKDVYQIGKDAACDLRLEGVFAPRKLAVIVRGHGGWKLVNVTADGKRVERNGAPVPDQAWLDDGDRLLLWDTEVSFLERAPRGTGSL